MKNIITKVMSEGSNSEFPNKGTKPSAKVVINDFKDSPKAEFSKK